MDIFSEQMKLHTTDKAAHCQKSAAKDTPQSTKSRAKPNGRTKLGKLLTDDHKTVHEQCTLTFLSAAKASSSLLLCLCRRGEGVH